MLVVAVVGGGAGAVVALRFAAPAAAPVPSTATAAATERRAEMVEQVSPAIVTVLADLPARTDAEGRRVEPENIGSGVVIHDQGLILTNYHVVAGAATLTVVLSTGERRQAMFVADDSPFNDVALLRVPPSGLRTVPLGDSAALRAGDPVTVISSGLMVFKNQVKAGVASAVNMDFFRPGVVMQDMVQTDTAVNHGDSGGALLNERGELVGLVTTVVRANPSGETVEGVGFAHSINSLRPVINAVIQTGANPRPRIGIERLGTQHVPVDRARLPENSPYRDGVAIVAVDSGSPAAAAGILAGDVVAAVNGQPIESLAPFVNLLGASPAGQNVELTVFRDGRQRAVTVSPRPVVVR